MGFVSLICILLVVETTFFKRWNLCGWHQEDRLGALWVYRRSRNFQHSKWISPRSSQIKCWSFLKKRGRFSQKTWEIFWKTRENFWETLDIFGEASQFFVRFTMDQWIELWYATKCAVVFFNNYRIHNFLARVRTAVLHFLLSQPSHFCLQYIEN